MFYNLLCIVVLISCAAINVMILMQKKRAGLSGSFSGMGASSPAPTYWDKNKGRSLEGSLEKYTKIGGAVFMVVALALNLIYQ